MLVPDYIREVAAKAQCLRTRDQVQVALDRMAEEIGTELEDANPVFVCIMIGGLITTGELLSRLHFPLELDYLHATRYQKQTTGGEEIIWRAEPTVSLKGRNVIIIDDILDKGLTIAAAIDFCESQGAAKVYSAILVDKQCNRHAGGLAKADFTGLEIEDKYVFGYGLDYKGYLRNYPGIYGVAKEHE